MAVNVSNAFKYFGGEEGGGGGGVQPEDLFPLRLQAGYNGQGITKTYDPLSGLDVLFRNLVIKKDGVAVDHYNPLRGDDVDIDIKTCCKVIQFNDTHLATAEQVLQDCLDCVSAGILPILSYAGHYYYVSWVNRGVFAVGDYSDNGYGYRSVFVDSAGFNFKDVKVGNTDTIRYDDPDYLIKLEQAVTLGDRGPLFFYADANGGGTFLPVGYTTDTTDPDNPVTIYKFVGRFQNSDVKYTYLEVRSDGVFNTQVVSSSTYIQNIVELQRSDFTGSEPDFGCSVLLENDTMYVFGDWGSPPWIARNYITFKTKSANPRNIVIRLKDCSLAGTATQWELKIKDGGNNNLPSAYDSSHTNYVGNLKNNFSYNIFISSNKWYCEAAMVDPNSIVTDAELAQALETLKSRIIYTIPLGAIDKVEKISMASGTGEIRIHATLFNPNMDQDLDANSNVVMNFGPTFHWVDAYEPIFAAIYEFDRVNSRWVWVANTDLFGANGGQNLNGIMHFPLTYKNANVEKLESQHLYLFCLCGNLTTELEVMGNELVDNINMNSSSLALATAKQNAGSFVNTANFGTDFEHIDLTTFSESAAQATVGTQKPVRVFAAITNLTNLP